MSELNFFTDAGVAWGNPQFQPQFRKGEYDFENVEVYHEQWRFTEGEPFRLFDNRTLLCCSVAKWWMEKPELWIEYNTRMVIDKF